MGGGEYAADLDFAGRVEADSRFLSSNGVEFNLLDDVDFKVSSSLDPIDIAALEPASGNIPTNFRLTKTGLAK